MSSVTTFYESKNTTNGLYFVPTDNIDITKCFIGSDSNEGKILWKSFSSISIDHLGEIQIDNKEVGDILCWNGSNWTNSKYKLSLLEDVNIENIKKNNVLCWDDGKWVGKIISSSGVKNINGQVGIVQSLEIGDMGSDFNIVSQNNNHIFNIPTASETNRGLLTNVDWKTFNGKLSKNIPNGYIFIGNNANVAKYQKIHGDATLSSNGNLELTNIINPGTYFNPQITIDSKGRITEIINSQKALDFGLKTINNSSGSEHKIITGDNGLDFNIITEDSITMINIPNSSKNSRGLLTPEDFHQFSNKLDNTLEQGKILIGNTLGTAQQRTIFGDVHIDINGHSSLSNTRVIPKEYGSTTQNVKIVVDEKGRITNCSNIDISPISLEITDTDQKDINVLVGTVKPNEKLIINIPNSSDSQRGALKASDFIKFSNKIDKNLTSGNILIGGDDDIVIQTKISGDITLSNTGEATLTDTNVIPGMYNMSCITVDSKGRITDIHNGMGEIETGNIMFYDGHCARGDNDLKFIDNTLWVPKLAISQIVKDDLLLDTMTLTLDTDICNCSGKQINFQTSSGGSFNLECGNLILDETVGDCFITSHSNLFINVIEDVTFVSDKFLVETNSFGYKLGQKTILFPKTDGDEIEGSFLEIKSISSDKIELFFNKSYLTNNDGIIYNNNGKLDSSQIFIVDNKLIVSTIESKSNLNIHGETVNLTSENDISIKPKNNVTISGGNTNSNNPGSVTISGGTGNTVTSSTLNLESNGECIIQGGSRLDGVKNPSVGIYGAGSMTNNKIVGGGDIQIEAGDIDVSGSNKTGGNVYISAGKNEFDGNNGNVIITAPDDGIGNDGEVRIVQNGVTYIMPKIKPSVGDIFGVSRIIGDTVQLGSYVKDYISSYKSSTQNISVAGSVINYEMTTISSGISIDPSVGIVTLNNNLIYNISTNINYKTENNAKFSIKVNNTILPLNVQTSGSSETETQRLETIYKTDTSGTVKLSIIVQDLEGNVEILPNGTFLNIFQL